MARETQLRLGLREERFLRFCMMGRVAVSATDTILCVHRIDGVHVLRASGMAAHAARINLLCGMVLENEELGFVAGILNVCCCRAMAAVAAHLGGIASLLQSGLPVRGLLPSGVQLFVAGLASVCGCILVGAS